MYFQMLFAAAPFLFFLLLLTFVAFPSPHLSTTAANQRQQQTQQQQQQQGCQRRYTEGQDSFVCVCNAMHCDTVAELATVENVPTGTLVTVVSDRTGKRLERQEDRVMLVPMTTGNRTAKTAKAATVEIDAPPSANDASPPLRLSVNPSEQYQTILGFGGAFSDSSGLNWNALSAPVRQHLLDAYFHPEKGIRYSIGRVPIGSTDFSTRQYSYVDTEDDFDLDTFAIAPEDFEAKIPFIKAAMQLIVSGGSEQFRLIACPWTAPGWMKSNGRLIGGGELKGTEDGIFYRTYAKYLAKFFEEYAKNGVNFWALSIQNQPQKVPDDYPFQSMFMSNHTQREFAAHILLPLLKQSPHTAQLKLLAFDDVREHFVHSMAEIFNGAEAANIGTVWCRICRHLGTLLPEFMASIMEQFFCGQQAPKGGSNEKASNVFEGIGVHWYTFDGHSDQDAFHEKHPDKIIISTEACAGFVYPDDLSPRLGNWTRGWQYGWDIVQNLRHWTAGWVDWNLCLDMDGGPNWVQNYVDAPIIVNAELDEFYKQPTFYFLAHFSRFMPPGSVRVGSTLHGWSSTAAGGQQLGADHPDHPIQHVAVITPTGHKVLVIINSGTETVQLRVEEVGSAAATNGDIETAPQLELGPEAIMTAIWH